VIQSMLGRSGAEVCCADAAEIKAQKTEAHQRTKFGDARPAGLTEDMVKKGGTESA
jgi:hypothetical protein